MEPDRPLLRNIAILAPLSEEELDMLGAELAWRSLPEGAPVVTHLEQEADVYFILEGVCRVSMQTPQGRAVAIRELGPGDHFGEIAALTGAPRSVAVEAKTALLAAQCPGSAFREAMARNGAFASAVAAHLARSVVTLTDRLYELAALETRFRLYAELLRLARAGQPGPEGVLIAEAPTHEALASAIGAQRESVTRELRQLAGEGLVEQRRRALIVRDIDKLRQMVEHRGGRTVSQLVDWRV